MITYRKTDESCLSVYDSIPMRLTVESEYRIEKIDRGLGGISLTEMPVVPYVKEFDEGVLRWREVFNMQHWTFFMAFDAEQPIAGLVMAARTPNVHMLDGRDDLAVLWDIRVREEYKHQGIGQRLFDLGREWARAEGFRQMKIECQNNNVPAVHFYHKQGAVLGAVNEYAYYGDPACERETQLIWYLDIL